LTTRIKDNTHLRALLKAGGFVINLDYPTKTVELHKAQCKIYDEQKIVDIDLDRKTQEMWFSGKYRDACLKAVEIAVEKDYRYSPCSTCIVNEQNWQLVSKCNLISK